MNGFKLLRDYRIGGQLRFIHGKENELMQIPDEMRKCVVFIAADPGNQKVIGGTAFIVAAKLPGTEEYVVPYLVTAKHNIEDASSRSKDGNTVLVRVNTKNGSYKWVHTNKSSWVFHEDDRVDVAVLLFPFDPELDHLSWPIEGPTVTNNVIANENIGLGEELCIVGLFKNHAGTNRNIPIVRVGHLAAMPEEKVKAKTGMMHAYLIEARSIGGVSGSPVFLVLQGMRNTGPEGNYSLHAGLRFYLLGLMHGHWDSPCFDSDSEIQSDWATREQLNSGIAVVVPSDRIVEILNYPKFQKLRAEESAYIQLQNSTTLDATAEPFGESNVMIVEPPTDGELHVLDTDTIQDDVEPL